MNDQNQNSRTINPLSKLFSNGWSYQSSNQSDPVTEQEEAGHLVVDMYERDNSYYIIAPAAGVIADDIEIELNDEFITIKGRRSQDQIETDRKNILQECYWGSFTRKIDFPTPVDSEKAAATFKDGLLTICVPKTKSAQTKTLKVKTL